MMHVSGGAGAVSPRWELLMITGCGGRGAAGREHPVPSALPEAHTRTPLALLCPQPTWHHGGT